MGVLNSFFVRGVGNSPIKKNDRGFCPAGWLGLELTDTLCPNSVRKLAKCGVTPVTSNQRKSLVEQCFDTLYTTIVQNFRSFSP